MFVYKPHDELHLNDGTTVYVSEDKGGDTIECYDTDDWNDVCDSTMYNMPIGMRIVERKDVKSHKPFSFIYEVNGKVVTEEEFHKRL